MNRGIFAGLLVVGMALAIAAPMSAAPSPVYSGIDLWATQGDGRTFFDFKLSPLPAGFFCAKSAPFEGRVVRVPETVMALPRGARPACRSSPSRIPTVRLRS